jgi:hypothetical protein
MTKVMIDPGICNLVTSVEAVSEDGQEVVLKVRSGCKSINDMFKDLGSDFDSFDLCLNKPGQGPLYDYAKDHSPAIVHVPLLQAL